MKRFSTIGRGLAIAALLLSLLAGFGSLPTRAADPPPDQIGPSYGPNDMPMMMSGSDPEYRLWERADYPVYYGKVQRSWLWGPEALAGKYEPYAEGKDGRRLVLYLDKARMEVNNPNADPNSPWYITTGLLVAEMVGGYAQVGNSATQPHPPSTQHVGGDGLDNVSPTYAQFAPLLPAAPDRSGQQVTATIDQQGKIGNNPSLGNRTSNAVFVAATSHNIPAVFWQFLNQQGLIYDGKNYRTDLLFNWIYTMGYPITDAYWTTVTISGQQHLALIQLYQRRSLTYVPDLAAGWQVEMGNVGRDYLDWRFGG